MIKAVDSLPRRAKTRKKTMLELIEEDLRGAVKNKIHMFEFCGKDYNLKCLQSYCCRPILNIYYESLEQMFLKYIVGKPFPVNVDFWNLKCKVTQEEKNMHKRYIHITHMTDKEGKDHVYGRISPMALKEAWERFYKPMTDAYIEYATEQRRKYEARKIG